MASGAMKRVQRSAARAGDSEWVERLGRLGIAAKGVSFGLVGVLALLVAFGGAAQPADRPGALRLIATKPYGAVILLALATGFGGYALWRFAQAILDRDDNGEDIKGSAKRIGYFGKGCLYAGLCAVSLSFVTGPRGESASEPERTNRVLHLPLGPWLVGAIGVAVIVAGLWNGYRCIGLRFRKDVETQEMSDEVEAGLDVVGILGHAARALVFTMIGFFLVRAAYQYDPSEAVGLDGALQRLAHAPYGTYWLVAVAAGLVAYAAFCLLQARYRDV